MEDLRENDGGSEFKIHCKHICQCIPLYNYYMLIKEKIKRINMY
jgi:hypothetical protein